MSRAFGDFCRTLSKVMIAFSDRGPADAEVMGRTIVAALGTLVHFDHSVTFSYSGNSPPADLFDTFDRSERHVFVTLYQQGPFLLDPFFRAASERRTGFWRMRELAPDRFYSSDYFHNYYVQTGLAEEVGFFVSLNNGAMASLSLMRLKKSRVFSSRDVALLRDVAPLISPLLQRCCSGAEERSDAVAARASDASTYANKPFPVTSCGWRELNLTDREASVVDLVLQGHSSDAIAHRLCIARGTVKVHRRNAYRKLGISSQAELLATYMNWVMRQTG